MVGVCGRSRLSAAEFEATLNIDDEDRGINDAVREVWRPAQAPGDHALPSTPRELLAWLPQAGQPLDHRHRHTKLLTWLDGYPEAGLRQAALYVISYGPDGTPQRLHVAGFSGD